MPFMPSVIRHCIAREKTPHQCGNPRGTTLKKEMSMIRQKRLGIAPGAGFRQKK
jgi:hypothetical protein